MLSDLLLYIRRPLCFDRFSIRDNCVVDVSEAENVSKIS